MNSPSGSARGAAPRAASGPARSAVSRTARAAGVRPAARLAAAAGVALAALAAMPASGASAAGISGSGASRVPMSASGVVATRALPAGTSRASVSGTSGAVASGASVAGASAAGCADVDVVVARGTFEPGTLGIIVGDPVYAAIQKKVTTRTTSSYPVDYPANLDVTSNPNSAQQGNADLVAHVTRQAAACPAQRFILVGYSQGANVVDNSIGVSSDGAVVGGAIVATIPASIEPRVAAVLLFGNPIRAIGRSVTGVYAARTDDFCATGDPVCGNGVDVAAHLSYGADADAAAAFAAARLGG